MKIFDHALVLGGMNGLYRVETEEGILFCRGATKLRKNGLKLLAGDRVSVEDNGDGTGFIRAIDDRLNSLVRPPVANVGLLILVAAASSPKPTPFLLDKLAVIAEKEQIPLVIAVTKSELGGAEELEQHFAGSPYPVFRLAERGKIGSDALFDRMRGKTSVFCGASGVGKSTLLNHLFPELQAEVGELSEKIQRGKNTTRATTLYRVAEDTYIADTPGFTMLETEMYCKIEKEELAELFPEFVPFLGQCRYTKCQHTCEDGCRILQEIADGTISRERHDSYTKLYQEIKTSHTYK